MNMYSREFFIRLFYLQGETGRKRTGKKEEIY